MTQMLRREGCVAESLQGEYIDMHVLSHKVREEKTISVDIFNQMLLDDCMFIVESENYKFSVY